MRLFAVVLSLGLAATSAHAATFSEDVLPDLESDGLLDPSTSPRDLKTLDLPPELLLETAQRNFSTAIDLLEQGLSRHADYASILQLAPQIRQYVPDNARIIWLHALALAATGSLDQARQALDMDAAADIAGKSPLPLLAQAMTQLREGDADGAARLVAQAIKRAPDNAYAHNLMGIIRAQRGEMEAARSRFSEAAQLSSEGLVYLRNLGLTEFELGRIEASANAIRKALDLNGQDCVSLVALAKVYEAWQRPDDAARMARTCLEADNTDPRAAAYLIRLQVAQNRFDAALATATDHADAFDAPGIVTAEIHLLKHQPDAARKALEATGSGPSVQHAFATAMTGDIDAALEEVRALSSSAESGVVALADAAFSAALGQQVADASRAALQGQPELKASMNWFAALRRAAAESPEAGARMAQSASGMMPGVRFDGVPIQEWAALTQGDNAASAVLGVLWLLRGYDQAASATFDDFLSNAEAVQIRYFAGVANVRLGKSEQARDHLVQAVATAPGFYAAQKLLAEVQLNLGQAAEALASYRRAVEVVEDGGALMKIGLLADHFDRPDVAEDALRRFIALYPESFIGYNQLAWVFVQRETRLNEALALAEKANSLQPGNASVLDNIGWIHHLRGDTEQAVELLREANRRSGQKNPDILYHLAVAEAAQGAYEASLALLDRLAEIAPEQHATRAKAAKLRQSLQ